ncbi:hypothetical protein [Williamwhitmania taraxaci]|uniref:HTH domain-containing protein n=1 Tax=Williamwhitmania taraxaci TaxID=1640674 RepID=A0A1G6RZP3_9BACT|nr:hypothetical protein [Williamwhitmania taraxaci]SDD09871.1 hypothetical protein SAMN05216323_10845 [Williamwhitmania taraxaci]
MAIKEIVKLIMLDSYLHKGSTGESKVLAKRIGVSRSTLFNMFDELKELGAEISYDAKEKSYCHQNNFRISLNIEKDEGQHLSLRDLEKIIGATNLWQESNIMDCTPSIFALQLVRWPLANCPECQKG